MITFKLEKSRRNGAGKREHSGALVERRQNFKRKYPCHCSGNSRSINIGEKYCSHSLGTYSLFLLGLLEDQSYSILLVPVKAKKSVVCPCPNNTCRFLGTVTGLMEQIIKNWAHFSCIMEIARWGAVW